MALVGLSLILASLVILYRMLARARVGAPPEAIRDEMPTLSLSKSDKPMAPPPRPPTATPPTTPRIASSLSPRPGPSARAPGTSTLAPPPTISGKPAKPSRKVVLQPGHSPLDWARVSATSDLRGLPPGEAGGYLRVGPARLRRQNGRRGADAWMALGGLVYNVQPYADFHPGGVGELLRGAAKDGGRLFNEAHPWVNYEAILASCLVGRLVSDEDQGDGTSGDMEEMD